MNLFRIHIKPGGGTADMHSTFSYCLKNEILGVGWRTRSNRNTKDWEEYRNEASEEYHDLCVCEFIKNRVNKGDLVWTRNVEGQYYLAQVTAGWEYWTSQDAVDKDIDIANVFRVVFQSVDVDAVPGKVIACFRARRSIQRIADEKAREYSKYLWNTL
jgi:hypothetical protein